MKITEILSKDEIDFCKWFCDLFHAQWVEIEGIRFNSPYKRKEESGQ